MSPSYVASRWMIAAVALLLWRLSSDAEQAAAFERPMIDVGLITEPTAHHRTGYLDVLATTAGVRRVAVVDPTGKTLADAKRRLGDRFYGDGFTSTEEMLTTVRPQLTVVTMEGHHAPAAILAALRADSHVLTEKPSCTKLEQFEEIARLAQQQQKHVMLAMATRSSTAIKKAKTLIDSGVLGKPYSVNLLWIADQTRVKTSAWQTSWVADPQRAGGGKLIYHGIHFLDVIQHLLGSPIGEINGFTENVGGEPIQVEDSAVLSFRFANGANGTLNTGYYLQRSKQTEIRIWGSAGWLELKLHERQPLRWYSTQPGQPSEVQTFDYAGEAGLYTLFFADAIEAIRKGTRPPITTAESLRALRVVFAGYEAAESGRTQTVAR